MPIFEFKCMQCEMFIEKLVMNDTDLVDLSCPECGAGDLERVLSTTNFAIPPGGAGSQGASAETRTCSSGSCTTYNLPGPE